MSEHGIHARCAQTTQIDGTRVICGKSRGYVISLEADRREHYDSDEEVRWTPGPLTPSQKEALAFHVGCPKCGAQENFKCRNLNKVRLNFLVRPHPERTKAALEAMKENKS